MPSGTPPLLLLLLFLLFPITNCAQNISVSLTGRSCTDCGKGKGVKYRCWAEKWYSSLDDMNYELKTSRRVTMTCKNNNIRAKTFNCVSDNSRGTVQGATLTCYFKDMEELARLLEDPIPHAALQSAMKKHEEREEKFTQEDATDISKIVNYVVIAVTFIIAIGLIGLFGYFIFRFCYTKKKGRAEIQRVAIGQAHVMKYVEDHNERVLAARAKIPAEREPVEVTAISSDLDKESEKEKSTDAKEKTRSSSRKK